MLSHFRTVFFGLLLACQPLLASNPSNESNISISQDGKSIQVFAGDDLFTQYEYRKYKKPIFFPVFGPQQIPMTRSFPMSQMPGEAKDHLHHKSIWIGHTINGVDFWTEQGVTSLKSFAIDNKNQLLKASHSWLKQTGHRKIKIAKDETTVRFRATPKMRLMDYRIDFFADVQDLEFADTKEGLFAIRVHPELRTSPPQESPLSLPGGQMKNSDGETGKGIWGKRSKWIHYFGSINGTVCGVLMMDHPNNLRYPTTWHARDYGLLAANPFGIHYFRGHKKGAGKYTVEKGSSITFRYRLVFHTGRLKDKDIEELASEFSAFD